MTDDPDNAAMQDRITFSRYITLIVMSSVRVMNEALDPNQPNVGESDVRDYANMIRDYLTEMEGAIIMNGGPLGEP